MSSSCAIMPLLPGKKVMYFVENVAQLNELKWGNGVMQMGSVLFLLEKKREW